MSIVALKRKTAAKYGNHSPAGTFSLNGVHRFVGVGPTNLAKSVTRTPFGGIDPKGHGGGARCRVSGERARSTKCSSAPASTVVHLSGSNLTTQTAVKASTKNTAGMLETRYTGILHGAYPRVWVMPQKLDHEQKKEEKALKVLYNSLCTCAEQKGRPCNFTPGSACVAPYTKDTTSKTSTDHQRTLLAKRFSAKLNFPYWQQGSECRTNYLRVEDVPVDPTTA